MKHWRKKERIALHYQTVNLALKRGFGTGYILSGVFDLELPSGQLVARWHIDQRNPNASWIKIQRKIRRMRSAAAVLGRLDAIGYPEAGSVEVLHSSVNARRNWELEKDAGASTLAGSSSSETREKEYGARRKNRKRSV